MKPTSLDDNIVYQCSDFTHRFSRLLQTTLHSKKLGITPEQLSVLVLLWYKGKATQQEISSGLRRDKTTIARVVANMEKKGLLSFSPHPTDNRSRLASLTRKGEQVQTAAITASGALYTRVLRGIDAAHLQIAVKVLAQMTRNCALFLLFWLTASTTTLAQTDLSLQRRYVQGDTYRYRLTCESWQNGKWTSTTISVCRLTVVTDSSGNPVDEITWESLKTLSPKDTIDGTSKAHSIKPYRVSLTPKGPLDMPPLTEPAMTESITDFHTFLVAIAPSIGIDSLKKAGDSFAKPIPVIGNFANGKNILKGEDCLAISIKLQTLERDTATLQTSFLPPTHPGMAYLLPVMDTPVVAGIPNNFQMVMPTGPGKFMVQYGREFFVIHSTLRTADGKLIHADMFNQLSLRLHFNCDSNYQHCQGEIPIAIERRLTLQLL